MLVFCGGVCDAHAIAGAARFRVDPFAVLARVHDHGVARHGCVRRALDRGERQFLRVSRSYVGSPPKQFIRLRRFHRTIQEMQRIAASDKPIDLMAVALNHGYYDLSHMALEFQQMGCVSPGQFRMLGIPLSEDFSVFFA